MTVDPCEDLAEVRRVARRGALEEAAAVAADYARRRNAQGSRDPKTAGKVSAAHEIAARLKSLIEAEAAE